MTYADGEIVARLRHFGKLFKFDVKPLFDDAANEIDRLREENRKLRAEVSRSSYHCA